ncbi:dihydropteroate synthase [Synechococcus sp. CBW1002]|jgi:dihydropteroate synthase|uniref:dihydropteroate synthase n=1 Tax=unclassified Synechococcus TaxID=2626047 RepID=UPI0018CD65B9|nr:MULTISPECIES: dihydropteroate synthase [unclassified Synechococcus]QPN59189.1 dihydropteroate synthase [Synechococcus sp. CBW1002]QPN65976.1 dihydropteroate synthase [Synechococcus sp. CBW1006]
MRSAPAALPLWGERTLVMGVVNLTPDSFSDGGCFLAPEAALRQALILQKQGADLLDLGAQSTRPGAVEVGADVELQRLMPSLDLILQAMGGGAAPRLSIDTFHAAVAEAALEAGAHWINDVSGGRRDPAMLPLVAAAGCPYVLMHSRGDSQTMDRMATYGAVVPTVRDELLRATDRALTAGVQVSQILWDPGLGFAKTTAQNLALLRGLPELRSEGFPLLLGPSRKRFIGEVLQEQRPRARLWGTAAVCVAAIASGADVLRVHDVGPIVQTARMADALYRDRLPREPAQATAL